MRLIKQRRDQSRGRVRIQRRAGLVVPEAPTCSSSDEVLRHTRRRAFRFLVAVRHLPCSRPPHSLLGVRGLQEATSRGLRISREETGIGGGTWRGGRARGNNRRTSEQSKSIHDHFRLSLWRYVLLEICTTSVWSEEEEEEKQPPSIIRPSKYEKILEISKLCFCPLHEKNSSPEVLYHKSGVLLLVLS